MIPSLHFDSVFIFLHLGCVTFSFYAILGPCKPSLGAICNTIGSKLAEYVRAQHPSWCIIDAQIQWTVCKACHELRWMVFSTTEVWKVNGLSHSLVLLFSSDTAVLVSDFIIICCLYVCFGINAYELLSRLLLCIGIQIF